MLATADKQEARFNFRATVALKDTIERAAALKGQDTTSFVRQAAYELAVTTIQAHEVTILKPEDHRAFFDALENPPEPTDSLRAAFASHRQRVIKR